MSAEEKQLRLLAEFQLDAEGKPIGIQFRKGGKVHFGVRLFVENAPESARFAEYRLDETFDQPKRKVPRTVPQFEEEIHTYGDFEVGLAFPNPKEPEQRPHREWLSKALVAFYEKHPELNSSDVKSALQSIKDN